MKRGGGELFSQLEGGEEATLRKQGVWFRKNKRGRMQGKETETSHSWGRGNPILVRRRSVFVFFCLSVCSRYVCPAGVSGLRKFLCVEEIFAMLKATCSDEPNQKPSAAFCHFLPAHDLKCCLNESVRLCRWLTDKYLPLKTRRTLWKTSISVCSFFCTRKLVVFACEKERKGGVTVQERADKYVWLHRGRFPALYANDLIQV